MSVLKERNMNRAENNDKIKYDTDWLISTSVVHDDTNDISDAGDDARRLIGKLLLCHSSLSTANKSYLL